MNIKNFQSEGDFLVKFVEKKGNLKKGKLQTRSRSLEDHPHLPYFNLASNKTFFLNFTAHRIFEVLDSNSDGFLDWYDFGNFFQVSFLFAKFDPYNKGRLTAGDAFEKYSHYSSFPRISRTMMDRARRLNLINQDTYIDLFQTLVVMRIDDIVSLYVRKTDKSTLYEVELKRIFNKVGLNNVNDGVLNKCVRGLDSHNIPLYDWECAFMAGLQLNIDYLESASSYNTAKANNLTLHNTVFYNVDPALVATPPKKFF